MRAFTGECAEGPLPPGAPRELPVAPVVLIVCLGRRSGEQQGGDDERKDPAPQVGLIDETRSHPRSTSSRARAVLVRTTTSNFDPERSTSVSTDAGTRASGISNFTAVTGPESAG